MCIYKQIEVTNIASVKKINMVAKKGCSDVNINKFVMYCKTVKRPRVKSCEIKGGGQEMAVMIFNFNAIN